MSIQIIKKDIIHINLRVKPTGEVILTAPLETTKEHIEFVLKKRGNWIKKKIQFYKDNQPPKEKEYVSGENFKYLGRNYRLKIIESEIEEVKLQQGYIKIFIIDKNNLDKKKKLLNEWYRNKATIHFKRAVEKYKPIVDKEVKSIKIREMKTRWGSCNPNKSYINLNSELIKKSTTSIEYVVFHELAHLLHMNHNRQFYNFMSTYMPDWKKRKEKLENRKYL